MNLFKALLTVSGMTMVSRVLGFIRDALIARIFGAGMVSDAFFVAFKLPNMLRRIFAEGAFSQAFVPILGEYKVQKTHDETVRLIRAISGMLLIALFFVTILGILIAPWIIYITAPGFSNEAQELAIHLFRWVFPYILLISLSSLLGSLLNTWGIFSIPAFTPALLNVSMILCSIFLAPYMQPPILALVIGVLIGGVCQLLIQLPYIKSLDLPICPSFEWNHPIVWRVIRRMGPALLGVSVAQISLVINTIFASYLVSGSVSWMYYADRLMELPAGVLGAALGTILLPSLSKQAHLKNSNEYQTTLDWGISIGLVLAIPAAFGLALLSKPLIATLFVGGSFSINDAHQTARALVAYAWGLPALILIKILAPAFYAKQNIKTPVKIAVFSLMITQFLNVFLVGVMQHAGLALAISGGAWFNALYLAYQLRQYNHWTMDIRLWVRMLLRISVSSAVMGLLIVWINYLVDWFLLERWQQIILLLATILGCGLAYFVTLHYFGLKIKHLLRRTT